MTDRELMQQALDLLDDINQCSLPPTGIPLPAEIDHVMEALRARLAQPEQQHSEQWWKHEVSNAYANGYLKGRVLCGCGDQIMPDDGAECGTCVTARNAVKQEPLAQMKKMLEVQGRDGTWNYDPYLQGMFNGMEFMVALAEGREPVFREPPERWLHTPPQREWQGLTVEEVKAAWSQLWYDLGNGKFAASDDPARHTTIMFAKEIEAKLKEKNT